MCFCHKKITDGEEWGHKLCKCSGQLQLCCRTYWCPCWIHGRTARAVDDPCCACCCFSTIACVGCWVGMRLRGRVREKYNINGTWKKDCVMSYFCAYCSLLQMAQEVLDREPDEKQQDKKKLTKETTLDDIDTDDMYY